MVFINKHGVRAASLLNESFLNGLLASIVPADTHAKHTVITDSGCFAGKPPIFVLSITLQKRWSY
jgi:hypothetical protein